MRRRITYPAAVATIALAGSAPPGVVAQAAPERAPVAYGPGSFADPVTGAQFGASLG